MAEQFPRAGQRQPGGSEMTQVYLTTHDARAPEITVLENPIPVLKKENWEFYTASFATFCPLMPPLNRFPRRKNSPNTAAVRSLSLRRNTIGYTAKISAPVTTSHVFRPNKRRKAVFSLRFWLPNSVLPVVNITTQWPRGGRGSDARTWPKALIEKPLRKFCLMGPLPCSGGFKKTPATTGRQCARRQAARYVSSVTMIDDLTGFAPTLF